jgi:hypothetical protein
MTYAILTLHLFNFRSDTFVVAALENNTVQIYDFATGKHFKEFRFSDNVISEVKKKNQAH